MGRLWDARTELRGGSHVDVVRVLRETYDKA